MNSENHYTFIECKIKTQSTRFNGVSVPALTAVNGSTVMALDQRQVRFYHRFIESNKWRTECDSLGNNSLISE